MLKEEVQPQKHIVLFSYLMVAFCSFFIYSNSFKGDFLFDDIEAVVKNQDVVGNSSLKEIFSHNFWGQKMGDKRALHFSYRPITILSFKLNYLLGGLSTWGYHFFNAFLHMCVSLLFFMFSQVIFKKYFFCLSFIAAMIFSLHPIHTEAVSSVVGRAELLAAFFSLLACLTYFKAVREKKKKIYSWTFFFLSLFLLLLSLISKETGITLLAILIIYDLLQDKNIFDLKSLSFKKIISLSSVRRVSLLLLFLIGIFFIRISLHKGDSVVYDKLTIPANHLKSFQSRFMTKASYNAWHLRLLAIPYPLSADRSTKSLPLIHSFFDLSNLQTLLCLLSLFLLLFYILKMKNLEKKKAYILSLSLMLIPFIPCTGWLFDVGFVTAERVLYLPSLGFSLLFALFLLDLYQKFSYSRLKVLAPIIFTVSSLCYAEITWNRNKDWQSEEKIFLSTLKHYPNNARAHFNYGYQQEEKNPLKAEEHYKKAIALEADYVSPYQNLCVSYLRRKKHTEGIEICKQAIAAYNRNRTVAISLETLQFNLALGYFESGQHKLARKFFEICLNIFPRSRRCKQYFDFLDKRQVKR